MWSEFGMFAQVFALRTGFPACSAILNAVEPLGSGAHLAVVGLKRQAF